MGAGEGTGHLMRSSPAEAGLETTSATATTAATTTTASASAATVVGRVLMLIVFGGDFGGVWDIIADSIGGVVLLLLALRLGIGGGSTTLVSARLSGIHAMARPAAMMMGTTAVVVGPRTGRTLEPSRRAPLEAGAVSIGRTGRGRAGGAMRRAMGRAMMGSMRSLRTVMTWAPEGKAGGKVGHVGVLGSVVVYTTAGTRIGVKGLDKVPEGH